MKKRTLAIILIVVLALAGLWLAREQTAQETIETEEPQVTSCLVALDEAQQANAAAAEAEAPPVEEPTTTAGEGES